MQDNILLAFRKRLKNRGYYEISIKKVKSTEEKDLYRLTCREPLSCTSIEVTKKLVSFHYLLK